MEFRPSLVILTYAWEDPGFVGKVILAKGLAVGDLQEMESIAMDGVPSVALAGLGGYGHIYVNALLSDFAASRVHFVAGIDPVPDGCLRLREIRGKGIPIFHSLEEFSASGRADLVILS